MLRLITPIILIGIAVTGFMVFVSPVVGEISTLKSEIDSYDEALDNSKTLEAEREKLTAKRNNIDGNDVLKLEKLLPNNVDNIRLILEIQEWASRHGMVLRDVKYDNIAKIEAEDSPTEVFQGSEESLQANSDYGIWDLEFSTQGSYNNFLNLLSDLESNLRIIDISSIEFSSVAGTGTNPNSDVYNYGFKVKTYWLKN